MDYTLRNRMRKIFLAHPSDFTKALMNDFAASHNLDCYLWDDFDDFAYLIDDMKPELLIIHQQISKNYGDKIEQGLAECKYTDYEVVILGQNFSNIKAEYKMDAEIETANFFEHILKSILKTH